MTGSNELETALAALCAHDELDLVDVELTGSTLQVTVEGAEAIDLDRLAEVTRAISALLDEREDLAPRGRYELEVTTPGLERRLRRPEHFTRAIGALILLRTVPGTPGDRRMEGTLDAVDDDGVLVTTSSGTHRVRFAEIERARTVFDWQSALRAADGERDVQRVPRGTTTTKAREARG